MSEPRGPCSVISDPAEGGQQCRAFLRFAGTHHRRGFMEDGLIEPGAAAAGLIDKLRGRALLRGFRGAPPVDEPALSRLLVHLSEIAGTYSDRIDELDLNPVVYSEGRWQVADALVQLRTRG